MENLLPALLSSLSGLQNQTQQQSTQTAQSALNPQSCVANLINHIKYILPKASPRLMSDADKALFESKDSNPPEKVSAYRKSFKQLKNFNSYFSTNPKSAIEDIRVFVNANSDSIIGDTKLTFLEKNANIFCGSSNSSINTKSCIPISYAFKIAKTYKKVKNSSSILAGDPVIEKDLDYSCQEQLVYHFLVSASSLCEKISTSVVVSNAISELVKKYGFKSVSTAVAKTTRPDPIMPFANQLLANINPATIASVLKEASTFLSDAPKILEETKKEHGNDTFVKTIEGVLGGKDGLETFANAFSSMAKKLADKIEKDPTNTNIMENVKDVINEDKKIHDIASSVFSPEKRQEQFNVVSQMLSSVLPGTLQSITSNSNSNTTTINNSTTETDSTNIDAQIENVRHLLEDINKKSE
jgi:hypothetical protein